MVEFIKKLNGESLNLSKEEFDSYMTGKSIAEGTNTVYMCDGLRLLHENAEAIKKLKEKQEKFETSVQRLESRLAEFRNE